MEKTDQLFVREQKTYSVNCHRKAPKSLRFVLNDDLTVAVDSLKRPKI